MLSEGTACFMFECVCSDVCVCVCVCVCVREREREREVTGESTCTGNGCNWRGHLNHFFLKGSTRDSNVPTSARIGLEPEAADWRETALYFSQDEVDVTTG